MISDEPTTTETAQNHFSTKAERTLLVTNATEYLSVVCVCVCVRVRLNVCVCVVTVIWRANRERASYIRSRSGSLQKSHLLTMYCCDTHICTNVKS